MADAPSTQGRKVGIGTIATIGFLSVLLVFTIVVAMLGWTSASDVQMSINGWIALGLRVFFSLLIGSGLMGLVFYSSRTEYHEAMVVHVRNIQDGLGEES
ncbi:hypothetical protein [Bradyrhizobium sp. NBAIM03]|uniref:hypothetical protein n=1 Tax=Bradyrhizobium sp. NBAIM03 TaxID=2793816 RepID=UPI003209E77D